MLDQDNSPSNNKTQLWLAVMSLIAALGGGVIANWDKIFPRPVVYIAAPTPAPSFSNSPAPSETKRDPIPEPPKEIRLQPQQRLPSVGPSFDCAKATYRSEHLVCSSPELAVLDLAMANAYRDAAARVRTRELKADLRNLQNHWLRSSRETCSDVTCLSEIYHQRITELNAFWH
ncbi:MAG TPA: hypothetical protein VGS07_11575 [Thermoanaerobaculia bacterium]|jgi:uncharacterized protein YecT (DUF1311 family)|nr:hypothetical protein [Thermoanaerobaculia bacterium]